MEVEDEELALLGDEESDADDNDSASEASDHSTAANNPVPPDDAAGNENHAETGEHSRHEVRTRTAPIQATSAHSSSALIRPPLLPLPRGR
jgi:hypothetical protein